MNEHPRALHRNTDHVWRFAGGDLNDQLIADLLPGAAAGPVGLHLKIGVGSLKTGDAFFVVFLFLLAGSDGNVQDLDVLVRACRLGSVGWARGCGRTRGRRRRRCAAAAGHQSNQHHKAEQKCRNSMQLFHNLNLRKFFVLQNRRILRNSRLNDFLCVFTLS